MLNIYTPDITHLPLLLIKIYYISNAKPVSLCLGNYSDISSHTLSMTCIGNNFLNKHIQSKFGEKRSGFFWAKHRNCCLPCVSPKVKRTWPLQMTSFQKRNGALPTSLDPHRSSARPRPALACQQLPPVAPQSSGREQRKLWAGGYSFFSPRSSNKEQKHGSCVVSQNTGNWEYVALVLMLWHVCLPLSRGTCS